MLGKAPTHNSGLQAADIAVTLAAWLAGYQDFAFADNLEIQMEPVVYAIGKPAYLRTQGVIMVTSGGIFP